MNLLEARQVAQVYRAGSRHEVCALDRVSLQVAAGSFTVVSGPSGSGKTTLLALLGALERPTRGHVLFCGTDLADLSDVALTRLRRRLGFVFQGLSLVPRLTAYDNIAYPLIPRGVPRAERQRRAFDWLSRFGMQDKLMTRTEVLSGGEQQRLAIARALAAQPEVLLADEPTLNLDQESLATLLMALHELQQQGKTLILASHDPRVLDLASQRLELSKGRLR